MNVYREPSPRPHVEARAAGVDAANDADVESSDVEVDFLREADRPRSRLTTGTYVAVVVACVVVFLLGYEPH